MGELIQYSFVKNESFNTSSSIILNEKQSAGLDIAISRYNQGYPYTCIAGYAVT